MLTVRFFLFLITLFLIHYRMCDELLHPLQLHSTHQSSSIKDRSKKLSKIQTFKQLASKTKYLGSSTHKSKWKVPTQPSQKCQQPNNNFMDWQSLDIVKYVASQNDGPETDVCNSTEPMLEGYKPTPFCQTRVHDLTIDESEPVFIRYKSLENQTRVKNFASFYNNIDAMPRKNAIHATFHKKVEKSQNGRQYFSKNDSPIKASKLANFVPCRQKLYNDFIFENYEQKQSSEIEATEQENTEKVYRFTENTGRDSLLDSLTYSTTGFKQRKQVYLINHNLEYFRKKMKHHRYEGEDGDESSVDQIKAKLGQQFQLEIIENEPNNMKEEDGLKKFIKLLSGAKKTNRTMVAEVGKSIYRIKLKRPNNFLQIQNSLQGCKKPKPNESDTQNIDN